MSLEEPIKALLGDMPSKDGVSPVEWCILAEDWIEKLKKDVLKLLKADQAKREALMAHLQNMRKTFPAFKGSFQRFDDIGYREQVLEWYHKEFEELDKHMEATK